MLMNWKDGIQNGNGNKTRETLIISLKMLNIKAYLGNKFVLFFKSVIY